VHVSTVSRAIAHKYIQTPQGIFEMKFFFTGGFQNVDGTMESWESIRQKLADIVAKEDKYGPLSDEEVADKLRASGVDIARRTVTKYRRIMKIPSSRQRREY
jgi:RNA polymerase sigma-54 factor